MDFDAVLNMLKSKNAGALKAILADDTSRRALCRIFTEEDAKSALENVRRGDTSHAKILFDRLCATPEGKALVAKLLAGLGGNING
ncbi:MAG: hypothetical protein IKU84_00820 [Clostridia bacterium]|nr:hypothetical protein [Clostridia bacterium]